MSSGRVRLALTVGDPGGIGPEITAALLSSGQPLEADLFIIGSPFPLLSLLPPRLRGSVPVYPADEAALIGEPASFPVILDAGGDKIIHHRATAGGGGVSGRAIEAAVTLAKVGRIEGIVTGPISKEALELAGYPYPGHTEMLSKLFGCPDCQMMMVSEGLRIVILTRDIPLRKVPEAVTTDRIKTGVRATDEALRELWGIETPVIAVAALNPHGGDGGVTGREEIDIIIPALEELVGEGFRVTGPLPADTLFHRWAEKGYDACIALYHDQGMIPFKIGGFENGVNMTIGLPVVRTSVCHGTAYDIAGQGESEPGSLEAALSLAIQCCTMHRRKALY